MAVKIWIGTEETKYGIKHWNRNLINGKWSWKLLSESKKNIKPITKIEIKTKYLFSVLNLNFDAFNLRGLNDYIFIA